MFRGLVLAILTVTTCGAQLITDEGLIVNAAGDSLRGQITVRRSDQNPDFLEFTADGKTTRYLPDQVKYFQMKGMAPFIGVITDVDKSPTRLAEFDDASKQVGSVKDSVFLLVAATGKLSLYKLVDETSKIHYFIGHDGTIKELIVIVRRLDVNGRVSLATTPYFRNQLKEVISACPRAEALIETTAYNQKSLMKLATAYNSCYGESPTKVHEQPKATVVVALQGGFGSAVPAFESGSTTPPTQANYTGSSGLTGGLILEVLAPRVMGSFSVVNELVFQRFEFTAPNSSGPSYYFDHSYIRYNLGGRFYINRDKDLRPFMQAGVGLGFAYKYSYEMTGYPIAVAKSDYGVHLAAGLKYKRFALQGRFDRSSGPSESVSFSARVNHWQALLAVDLNNTRE